MNVTRTEKIFKKSSMLLYDIGKKIKICRSANINVVMLKNYPAVPLCTFFYIRKVMSTFLVSTL